MANIYRRIFNSVCIFSLLLCNACVVLDRETGSEFRVDHDLKISKPLKESICWFKSFERTEYSSNVGSGLATTTDMNGNAQLTTVTTVSTNSQDVSNVKLTHLRSIESARIFGVVTNSIGIHKKPDYVLMARKYSIDETGLWTAWNVLTCIPALYGIPGLVVKPGAVVELRITDPDGRVIGEFMGVSKRMIAANLIGLLYLGTEEHSVMVQEAFDEALKAMHRELGSLSSKAEVSFCPEDGLKRLESALFCGSCGYEFPRTVGE